MTRLFRPFAAALFTALTCLAAALPLSARADERPYAFTYEPYTEAAGETEVELYGTYYVPAGGDQTGRKGVTQLELGHGITDRFDLAFYTVFTSTTARPVELTALKLRGRYRLLSAATAPLDVVLYLEGEKELVDDRPWVLEEKLILGRDFGRLGVSLNLVAEQEFVGGEVVDVWGWAAGAAVRVGGGVRLGAESFGEWEEEAGVSTVKAWLGPSAVVALPTRWAGGLNSAWLTLGLGFGLNRDSDDLRARAILGIDF